MAAAAWAPSGRVLLLSFGGGAGGGGGVVAMHLVGEAPSLVIQMLPVSLAEVTSLDRWGAGDGCVATVWEGDALWGVGQVLEGNALLGIWERGMCGGWGWGVWWPPGVAA